MKVVAIVQARMGSTRLPGKVLLPVAGIPIIDHVIRRVQVVQSIAFHDTIVAIPATGENDELADHLQSLRDPGVRVYRGDEHDVLARYMYAASLVDADVVIRITADCPLIDWRIVATYTSSFLGLENPTRAYMNSGHFSLLPHGQIFQFIGIRLLMKAYLHATKSYDREHVIPWIQGTVEAKGTSSLLHPERLADCPNWSRHRWVIDTQEDYDWLCTLAEHVDLTPPRPYARDLVTLLEDKPWLARYEETT